MNKDHWWWNIPEFVHAQQDERFRAWVETISLGIDIAQIDFRDIIPNLPPGDMFSDEAILLAEQSFLQHFDSQQDMDDNWDTAVKFLKYLGQAYVAKLECRWVWQPIVPKYWSISGSAIEFPWPSDMLFELNPILNSAVRRRAGNDWLFVFKNNREDYLKWKAEGSPKSWDWP
ncbi:hypothetical protein [Mycobacteroides chelonae]|uniref:hypothetical protein n=1 Tax=Mycobacteroides chelonae TaxID=1774 RepID=UPI000991A04A|nr:hypothetical protein [Mycobacteroides chelonae]